MELSHGTQARLGRMIDTAYYLFLLAAFYLFMSKAFWLVFPFLFSFFLAALLQRPMNFFQRKFKIKKGFTAFMLVLLIFLALLGIAAMIGMRIFGAARDFGSYLTAQIQNLPEAIRGLELRIAELAQRLPDAVETRFTAWLGSFTESLLAGENARGESVGMFQGVLSRINFEWFKAPMSGVLSAAGRIPAIFLAVAITIISSFFMTMSYDTIAGFIKRQFSPEQRKGLSAAKRIVFSSLAKLLRAYLSIIVITFAELSLGLLLLRLLGVYSGDFLLGIALVTAVLDILPVLGTGMVLTPWGLYNIIMGNFGMGIGLLVLMAVVMVVRQIIEPKLVANNLGLPPVVTLGCMYFGLQLFGFIGIIIMPVLVILLKLLNDEGVIRIWKAGPQPENVKPAKNAKKKPAKAE